MSIALPAIEQSVTVRLSCHGQVGTGVILPAGTLGFICIATAKHVITGKKFDKPAANLVVDKIVDGNNELQTVTLAASDYIFYSQPTEDICILVLRADLLPINYNIAEQLQFVDNIHRQAACSIRGYASLEKNKENVSIACIHQENKAGSPYRFKIQSTEKLDTRYQEETETMQGISGGGVFLHDDGMTQLVGIVLEYANVNYFYCIRLNAVNELLAEAGHALLPFVQLETDPTIKKAIMLLEKNERILKAKIRDKIGNLHINRIQGETLAKELSGAHFLLIQGDAGAGKSALAKQVAMQLDEQSGVRLFMFNGEQFSYDSIDEVLIQMGLDVQIKNLLNSPLSQTEKLFWIDGIEKIIETSKTGAFTDLLELAAGDPSVRIMATSRSYANQQFLFHFSAQLPPKRLLHEVTPLSNEELAEVTVAYPGIHELLQKRQLNAFLRIPFYLNYAVKAAARFEAQPEVNLSDFKTILWEEVIEADTKERGRVFETISVKRAKEMSLFTVVEAEENILKRLLQDHIIISENDILKERFTPAHDVLEDWALCRYIKRHFKGQTDPKVFFAAIGTEPAIRRAYRLWLTDELQTAPEEVNSFINSIISEKSIEPYWKDETLVSLLRSDQAEVFFTRNEQALLAHDGLLLHRIINLLRTACLDPVTGFTSCGNYMVTGSGWAATIRFIQHHSQVVLTSGKIVDPVFQLINAWSNKLIQTERFVLPPESREAGLLLLALLNRVKPRGYNGNTNRRDLDDLIDQGIRTLFQLVEPVKKELADFLRTAIVGSNRTDGPVDFQALSFYRQVIKCAFDDDEKSNICLCIVLPMVVIELIQAVTTPAVERHRYTSSRFSSTYEREPEEAYGIDLPYELTIYTASALHTPFYHLLKYHPFETIKLILQIINKTVTSYRTNRLDEHEVLEEITLHFEEDIIKKQFGNFTWWRMYRGNAHGTPVFLQCMLMALEKFLLEIAASDDIITRENFQSIFGWLLRESDSIAITAVLASVALAFPAAVGKSILPLFSAKEIILWENERSIFDLPQSFLFLPDRYDEERKVSDDLPHRKYLQGFSRLIFGLQANGGSIREEIFAILDRHKAALTTTDGIIWRKTLAEIDIRTHVLEKDEATKTVWLTPSYDKEVQDFMDEGKSKIEKDSLYVQYNNRIRSAYAKDVDDMTVSEWRSIHKLYMESGERRSYFALPAQLAIIGQRELDIQLIAEERQWCFTTLISFAESLISTRENRERFIRTETSFDILEILPVLEFLPRLLAYWPKEAEQKLVKCLILTLLTAPLYDNEAHQLLKSIRQNLWELDQPFAQRCVSYLVAYTYAAEQLSAQHDRYTTPNPVPTEQMKAALILSVLEDQYPKLEYEGLPLTHITNRYLFSAFIIIPYETRDPQMLGLCFYYVKLHIGALEDNIQERNSNNYSDERRHIIDLFPLMILRASVSFGEEVMAFLYNAYLPNLRFAHIPIQPPREDFINKILTGFANTIDGEANMEVINRFWHLWQHFHQLNVNAGQQKYGRTMLLNLNWKMATTHWPPLEGREELLSELIKYYGQKEMLAVITLVTTAGNQTLMPVGISWVKELLSTSSFSTDFLKHPICDLFVERAFFKFGKEIRKNPKLTSDFIVILNRMIWHNSTVAFYTREELITFKAT
ncbi:hypothetical protein [Chitinophaga varians]|uniref:hypothetical protein n=1 Tax=Chitinophaga varians TaxID=2202339 RepID=UPI00165FAA68|nr:hypothetical protein [Chitinophaga varians]MBC9909830.1 hypothetical protein [Chitinophaga varians]